MDSKVNFRFHSNALAIYLLVSGIGFCLLLFIIGNVTLKMDYNASLERDTDFILNGIKTSILESSELSEQGHQEQSQTLLQRYLDYTFEKQRSHPVPGRFVKASIYFLNPERQLVAEWISSKMIAKECLTHSADYFEPDGTDALYVIELTTNVCAHRAFGVFEYHVLTAPIIVAFFIVFLWGMCIYMMFDSVKYAGKLLGSREDTDELIEDTKSIRWRNVATLTQKALVVRGRNLQYYQTLVLDTQHDIAKILDLIIKKYDDMGLKQDILLLRGVVQRLVAQIRSPEGLSHDVTTHREISKNEFMQLIQEYFSGVKVHDELPKNLNLTISDIFLFERILVNLSSNAIKHSKSIREIHLSFKDKHLQMRVFSIPSFFEMLKLHFAVVTKRVDVINVNTPVYSKIIGRTGRGLSIIKKGVIKLGGRMIFSISKKVVEVGFDLPAYAKSEKDPLNVFVSRKKVIYFEKSDFQKTAEEHGLKKYMITKKEFDHLMSKENENKKIELVTDVDIAFPEFLNVKIIYKKERIKGIAHNWLEETKSHE